MQVCHFRSINRGRGELNAYKIEIRIVEYIIIVYRKVCRESCLVGLPVAIVKIYRDIVIGIAEDGDDIFRRRRRLGCMCEVSRRSYVKGTGCLLTPCSGGDLC